VLTGHSKQAGAGGRCHVARRRRRPRPSTRLAYAAHVPVVGAFVGSYRIRPAPSYVARGPRGRWSPSPAESAVATNASTTHVSERPTVRARASTRARIRGPSRAWALGSVAVPCAPAPAPAPARPPACAAAFGRALPFVLDSWLSPSAVGTRPGSIFNAPARALPFFFFFQRR